jgi:hypothetical protein
MKWAGVLDNWCDLTLTTCEGTLWAFTCVGFTAIHSANLSFLSKFGTEQSSATTSQKMSLLPTKCQSSKAAQAASAFLMIIKWDP